MESVTTFTILHGTVGRNCLVDVSRTLLFATILHRTGGCNDLVDVSRTLLFTAVKEYTVSLILGDTNCSAKSIWKSDHYKEGKKEKVSFTGA